jgi:hypothetical protein
MMHIKKVLLIDDKNSHQKGCGTAFVANLNDDLERLIDFRESLDSVVDYSGDKPELVVKLDDFCCILIHASYDAPLLSESKLSEIYLLLNDNNLVLFSGNSVIESDPNKIKRTSRERLFGELGKMLSVYSKIGFFHTPFLYEPKTKLQKPLIHELMDLLEVSKDDFLQSKNLKIWLTNLGYSDNYEQVIENYSKLSVIELNEKLGDWLLKEMIW